MALNHHKFPAGTPSNRISYGGYTFSELVKTSVEITPVLNTAKTTIKYLKQTFTIEAIISSRGTTMIAPNNAVSNEFPIYSSEFNNRLNDSAISCDEDSTDTTLDGIKATLMTPHLSFYFQGKGYGDKENYSSADNPTGALDDKVRDVLFGPMPKMLSWEPIANNKFARIVWKVEIHRKPACRIARHTYAGINLIELWSTTKVSINASGYQTITRRGEIEIPAHNTYSKKLKGGELLQKYRQIVESSLLTAWGGEGPAYSGFHLASQDYDFSEDHTKCSFTLSWKEVESPNPLPEGVKDIEVRHRTRSELYGSKWMKNFKTWRNDFSAKIILFPRQAPVRAWTIFTRLLNERLDQAIDQDIDNNGNRIIRIPLILSINIEESLFSHEYKFDVSWGITSNPTSLFLDNGMFGNVDNPDLGLDEKWRMWTISARLVQNSYGAYPVEQKDISINLGWCETYGSAIESSSYGYSLRGMSSAFMEQIYNFRCPPEAASYIEFQNSFVQNDNVDISYWQRYRTDTQRAPEDPAVDNRRRIQVSTELDNGQVETDYVIQDKGRDTFSITMRGYAIRMGGPTQPPVIFKVGGKKVVKSEMGARLGDFVSTSMIGQYGNCPIYLTVWQVSYTIKGKPEGDVETNIETSGKPNAR